MSAISFDDGKPVVVHGPGYTQHTPASGSDEKRHYEFVGKPGEHRSISGLPSGGDFASARGWMCGSWAEKNHGRLAAMPTDEVRKAVALGGADELAKAAKRGTAVHKYAEAVVTGAPFDWAEIEAAEAGDYIAAVDAYFEAHPPSPDALAEVVVGSDVGGIRIGGTVDLIDRYRDSWVAIDYKTRKTGHDKRASEVLQLGAYAECVTIGYGYLDARGHWQRLDHVSHVQVVTFAPDGTFAIHKIDVDTAIKAHHNRMHMLLIDPADAYVDTIHGAGVDAAEIFAERLANLEPAERDALKSEWVGRHLPRIADLTAEHHAAASAAFDAVAPFRTPPITTAPWASDADVAALAARVRQLPADLQPRDGLRGWTDINFTVDDLAMWQEAAAEAEWRWDARGDEIVDVLDIEEHLYLHRVIGNPRHWTRTDLELAYIVRDAVAAGYWDDGVTEAGEAALLLTAGDKRAATAHGKTAAAAYGRPRPTKFSEVTADLITFSAALAAAETSNQQADKETAA